MLRLIARVDVFDDPTIPEEQALDRPEHRALIRRAGAEGMMLLKNSGVLSGRCFTSVVSWTGMWQCDCRCAVWRG